MKLFGRWTIRERKESKPEEVTFGAIEYKGRRFVSDKPDHREAYEKFKAANPGVELTNEEAEKAVGWMTSEGRFVLQEEAMRIGIRSGQVDVANVTSEKLYSSDLKKQTDSKP